MIIELKNTFGRRGNKSFYITVFLIILTLLEFFSFNLLNKSIVSNLVSTSAFSILGLLVLFKLTQPKATTSPNFIDIIFTLIIINLAISIICAFIYWEQPVFNSVVGLRYYYVYALYFLLLHMGFSKFDTEKLILTFFYLTLIVFFFNVITFPNILFAWRSEERREGLSIFFYGQGFTALGGFYFLSQYIDKKKITHLILFFCAFACLFYLTRSRGNFVGLCMGSVVMVLFSKVKNKKLIVIGFIVVMATFLYLSQTILLKFSSESQKQLSNYTGDVRFKADTYFITTFQTDLGTYLFGNGIPYGNSKLQVELTKLATTLGFYDSDLGIVGLFVHFGLFVVVIWMLIALKVFTAKSDTTTIYIKGYFAMVLSSAFTGFTLLDPGYMPATVIALYLLRINSDNVKVRLFDQSIPALNLESRKSIPS